MGQGGGNQETLPAPLAESRQRQTGIALDEAVRDAEIANLDAHAEDPLPAVGGEVRNQTGAIVVLGERVELR